jgi:hypothetical protein
MPNPEHVQAWLESTPVLAELTDSKQLEMVQSLVGHEGFHLFLGLLLGSRQAFYTALSAIPLDGAANAARASVLQGQIKGIDLVRQTVLEQFMPAAQIGAQS